MCNWEETEQRDSAVDAQVADDSGAVANSGGEQAPEDLVAAAEDVQSGHSYRITVRDLLSWFDAARRRHRVVAKIRDALDSVGLETFPDFEGEYIDNEIFLVKKGEAPGARRTPEANTTPTPAQAPEIDALAVSPQPTPAAPADPMRRLGRLKAANTSPISVKPDDRMDRATTLMLSHDFSQLPVMTTDRDVKGVVSWKTIGSRLVLGRPCEFVRDCMEPHQELPVDASIFEAIVIIADHDFVLVRKRDRTITGIVTATDINVQFHQLAEPFLLLADVENQMRNLIGRRFTKEDFQQAKDPADESRQIESVSDLTFGEYVHLLENEENWGKLQLQLDRRTFVGDLEEIRQIRNDVMHFDPDGISDEQLRALRSFARFLTRLDNVTRD